MHLYGYLDRLRENAIYCVTDSVTFIQPLADCNRGQVGNMQSELKPTEHG